MSIFKPKKTILDIAPYIPGESGGKSVGTGKIIKLSSNESPFGPSELAVKAIKNAASNAHRYPDGDALELRNMLAKKNNINAKDIICGSGSDEIISLLCQAFAGEGDDVLYSEHGFLMYPISALASGATPVKSREQNYKADPQALLDNVGSNTRIIFLANPNNPTGSYWTRQEILDFNSNLPENVILVLDAAYAEFVDDPDYTAGHDLVAENPNIVVTRTFSKIHGLGGLRLGWGHACDEIIDILNRIRSPFNVNSIVQAAGVAALESEEFVQKSIEHNKNMRKWFSDELKNAGLNVLPSQTNFVLVEFDNAQHADDCRQYLKEQNIFVRQMSAYGLPAFLRISMGLESEMKLALSAIFQYLNK